MSAAECVMKLASTPSVAGLTDPIVLTGPR